MKTYEQVIERAGSRIFGSYMGGSYEYYSVVDVSEIAFIFEKTTDQVSEDAERAFKMLVAAQVARHAAQGK